MDQLLRVALRRQWFRPLRTVRRFCQDPFGAQEAILRRLLRQAAGTEYGRLYGFAELARRPDVVDAYQRRVPPRVYDDFRDDILRMRRGAPDVLWPGVVRRYATSAGTTAHGKQTPATDELLRANVNLSAAGFLSYLAETENLASIRGMPLMLTGFVADDPKNPGVRVGEISGHGAEQWYDGNRVRRFLARRRTLPAAVRRIAEWDLKLDAIVDHAMHADVRVVAGVPSWALQLFDRLIDRYNRRHAAAVHTVGEIWPNLQLFVAGGVPLRAYRDALVECVGLARLDFVELYGASEASLAFQSSQADPALMLHVDNGVFFEFVRFDELAAAAPRRYTVADIEPDVEYVPLLTTCAGLWAYRLDDVLRFTSVAPHKLQVVGRASELLDTYGEFLRGSEVRAALEYACHASAARVSHFHVAPRPAGNGRAHAHEWLIEFDVLPRDRAAFAQALDEHLLETNPMYACCRREKGFGAPEVTPLVRGSFQAWLRASRAYVSAQTKVPAMSDNRDFADGLVRLCGTALLS